MQKVQNPYSPLQRQHYRNMLEQKRRDREARFAGELRQPTTEELREKREQCKLSLRPVAPRSGDCGPHPLEEKRRSVSEKQLETLEAMFEAERVRVLEEENKAPTRAPRTPKMDAAQWGAIMAKRGVK